MPSLPWMVDKLAAEVQPALILVQLVQDLSFGDLLLADLDREVGLAERNNLLLRVGVLDDQIAGVARELMPCSKFSQRVYPRTSAMCSSP